MKTRPITKFVRALTLAAAVAFTFAASATTYYWKGGTADYGDYAKLANWSTESATGADAKTLPGASDDFFGSQSMKFDLAGKKYQIAKWNPNSDWNGWDLSLKNGELEFLTSMTTHSGSITIDENGVLTMASTMSFSPADGDAGVRYLSVKNGGVWNFYGKFYGYHWKFTVDEGGEATIDTANWGGSTGSCQADNYLKNSGTLNLPHGWNWVRGGYDQRYDARLEQLAGTLNLGGAITRKSASGSWTLGVNLKGGAVNVTDDAAIEPDWIKLSSQIDFTVAEGKRLTMGPIEYADGAVVVKLGEGTMAFGGELPPALIVKGGAIAVGEANSTFSGSVDSVAPCVFEIGAKGFTFDAANYSEVHFKVANGVFDVGDVIMTCADAAVLAGALADLTGAGVPAEIVGTTLVKAASSAKFVSTTITDLGDPAGWANGQLPPAGSEVSIEGEGVVADVSSSLPNFSKITVADGAELRVSIDTAESFPCVAVIGPSKLTVSGKMNVSQLNYLTTSLGAEGELPTVEVVAGGVLTVPGGMNFKNVDLRLTGADKSNRAVVQTKDGTLTFGYAAAGETTKIAFTAQNGLVITPGARGKCNTRFAYAEDGGQIAVVGDLTATATEFKRDKGDDQHQHGFNFGHGTDPEVPFNVIFDSCGNVTCLYDTTLEGGAVVTVKNRTVIGSTFTTSNNGDASKVQIHVLDKAKLVIDGESSLQIAITANWQGSYLDLSPSEDGWESLVVKNGSFVYLPRQQGNGKARITVEDGIWDCFYTHWWGGDRMQWIFNHAKEVYVPEGKTLTVRLVNVRYGSDQGSCEGYFPMSWTPIVGEGNVVVGSCPKAFRLEVESGSNTCTGTISVDSTQQNNSLFFEDGANWAGKVVWDGRVSAGKSVWKDNSSGAEYMTPGKEKSNEPFEVSFGAVELRVPMTLRLWGGEIVKNDKVNLTGVGWIVPEDVDNVYLNFAVQDDYEVVPGDRWMIGTMPVDQELPKTSDLKWQLETEAIDGDDDHVYVFVRFGTLDYVFGGTGVTDMNDPLGWNLQSVPKADDEVSVAGAGVVAEMTEGTPNFASVTVRDGATFNVVSERTLNPVSLEAGTTLGIDVRMTSVSKSGYVTKKEMPFAEGVEDIDLSAVTYSATMGGSSWTNKSKPSEAAYVVKNEDGSVTVQFQRADDVYTKAAFVKFELRDGTIYASGTGAAYKTGLDHVGTDMSNGSTSQSYAESDTTGGYGVKDVTLVATNGESFRHGGAVKANDLVTYGQDGVVKIDVAEGCVLDLSEAAIDAAAGIVKTGAGTLVLDAVIPANLKIAEGSIGLLPEKEYDLSKVEIADGVTFMAKTATGVQPGYAVEKDGKVILKALGTFMGSGSWLDPANWAGGVIPGEGQTAFITQGSSAVIDDAITTPGSIELEDGTTLSVLEDVTLPALKLAPTAKVLLGNNADALNVSLTATPNASFATIDEEIVLPVFNVATNVTLTVPGNTYFKNLDMTVCGKVTTPEINCGMVRFGYAAKGETSYIKLVCDNAEIRPLTDQSYLDGGAIGIVYPDAGGTVIPLADIVMRSTKFNTCGGWAEWRNTYFGENNPADVDFNVIWDNTLLECSWGTKVAGAAHMFFRNNAYVRFNADCINHGAGDFQVKDSATMVFEDATTYFEYCQSGRAINLSPTAAGFEQVFFKNGARLVQNGFTGNKNAIVTFENGEVVIPDKYRQYDVLNNVGSVAIAKDKWLTIKGAHQGQGDDWDRVIKFADVPVTGAGSLVVTNTAAGKLMDVTIVNGANTATGLALAAAEEGTMLRFADGANWAGTVVANGHVALTNLTDGAAATTVTFGNLRLASGEFLIRTFRDANGALVCDCVNLTGAIIREAGDTGVILLTGAEPEAGEKLFFGTAPAGAWKNAVIKTASGRYVVAVESKPDEHGLVTVTGKIPTGFCITIQ